MGIALRHQRRRRAPHATQAAAADLRYEKCDREVLPRERVCTKRSASGDQREPNFRVRLFSDPLPPWPSWLPSEIACSQLVYGWSGLSIEIVQSRSRLAA